MASDARTLAELQIFQDEFGNVLQVMRRGLLRADFQAFKLAQLRKMNGSGVGELTVVGESQPLEVGELAQRSDPFVVGSGRDDIGRPQPGDVARLRKVSMTYEVETRLSDDNTLQAPPRVRGFDPGVF